ncbi:MAG: bifunctional 5,10-methylenetetrahydrofolate dehydrogenase/5,10-methenyltetrahydrofolate cyclohydrolase [Candidatus Nealsonbacteria bacterium]|nr:bifunctional 5,10-methylenetetrahydrofolate dehydrogenase/5,10-methenyltetrahydrofolate cyclohydrolase [Candidatus Nealsonbacteria bacterium]
MAAILDGKKLAEKILESLKKKILRTTGVRKNLKLVAVLVGNDPQSMIFLRQKEKACNFTGVDFQLYQFPENTSQEVLEEKVKEIGGQDNNGIIVQLPLPKHIDAEKILSLIPAEKDVDALSGKETKPAILSPVLAGILAILKEYRIDFNGKKIAVVGKGRLVGQPIIDWFKKHSIEVSDDIKKADIVISGVGKLGFVIKGDMIKKNAVVVDAAGDIDQKSVALKSGYFTPTPGGVGPMTVAMVIKNLLILNRVLVD